MAKLVRVDEDENGTESEESVEAQVNEELVEQGESLGVAFGCIDGRCGSCRVEIISGMENLNKRTQEEKDMGLEDGENYRLLCQCRIKNKDGLVKVRV